MSHESDASEYPVKGRWRGVAKTPGDSRTLNDNDGVFAVHAALMHTGRIIMFSGRAEGGRYLYRSWTWDPSGWGKGDESGALDNTKGRWFASDYDPADPENPTPAEEANIPSWDDNKTIDLFCAHQVFLEDGRLLVVGGASGLEEGDARGNPAVYIYDPVTEKWQERDSMDCGRWYPTAVVLPDGQVAIFSGRPGVDPFSCSGGHAVRKVEVLGPPDYSPRTISGADRRMFIYPCLFLTKGGRVFYAPTGWAYEGISPKADDAATLNRVRNEIKSSGAFRLLGPDSGTWEPSIDLDPAIEMSNPLREEGTAVLLPPARDGRILVIGGGLVIDRGEAASTPPPRRIQHSAADATSCEILETSGPTPFWSPAGNMYSPRINVSAVLLPDGKVLIIGGHDRYKWDSSSQAANVAELYDPTVPYTIDNPRAAFTELTEMHFPRIYHSTALLLPDGRVWVASGDGLGNADSKTMEFYEPPYLHRGQQPVINPGGLQRVDGPNDQIVYGGTLFVNYSVEEGKTIDKVVLIRPGAITHHTNTDQRYEDIPFTRGGTSRLRVQIPSDPSILPPGYYMLWIIDNEGRPCERASFVRLSHETCTLVTDKSHYSSDEYAALTVGGGSLAEFNDAVYVIVSGFIPSEIDITTISPTQAQLNAWAPGIVFNTAEGGSISGLSEHPKAMYLEVSGPDTLKTRQSITFKYSLHFTGSSLFPADGAAEDTRTLLMSASTRGHTCRGLITLTRNPNPYMLDVGEGNPHWLSIDLRVFTVKAGDAAPGVPSRTLSAGSPNPNTFISGLLADYDDLPDSAGHPFLGLPTDQQESRLYASEEVDGKRIYNFVVAKVRYRGLALSATDVRVFFRLFTTAATSLVYRNDTYPRRTVGAHVLPELAQNAEDILSIPVFAADRSTLNTSGDPANVKTLSPDPGGAEVHSYFGAWLDINQSTGYAVDPEDGVLKSIQELIRGEHQCLAAEIYFEDDPIPVGVTPANNDNLSQRNLAIVPSDNPGGPDAHKIVHTFEIRPTWFAPQKENKVDTVALARLRLQRDPDELMIIWGNLPKDSEVTLYMPSLDADEIVALVNQDFGATRIERIDAHTLRIPVADVAYVPLPARNTRPIAGLLTIQLPTSVKNGQQFRIEARQLAHLPGQAVKLPRPNVEATYALAATVLKTRGTRTNYPQQIMQKQVIGIFELLIPVSTADLLLADAVRTLAVMKHIASKILPSSRWYLIFKRYLLALGDRVRGFGGDPTRVQPDPRGGGTQDEAKPGHGPHGKAEDCHDRTNKLLKCLNLDCDDIASIKVKRITVDIKCKDTDC